MGGLPIFDERLPGPASGGPAVGGAAAAGAAVGTLELPFEQRQKARQRARLKSGDHVGLRLPRGTVLRGGDRLRSRTGELVDVVAAPEPVSTAASADAVLLARAAYHLGNRHVALEVGDGWVRYLTDHVLDEMVAALGLRVTHALLPFEPEAGAYDHGRRHHHGAGHGHASGHDEDHDHDHDYDHDDDRGHMHDHGR